VAARACISSAQVDRNTGVHRKTTVCLQQQPSTGLHVTSVMAGRRKRFSFHGRRSSRPNSALAGSCREKFAADHAAGSAPAPPGSAAFAAPRCTGYSVDKRVPASQATLIP